MVTNRPKHNIRASSTQVNSTFRTRDTIATTTMRDFPTSHANLIHILTGCECSTDTFRVSAALLKEPFYVLS